MIQELKKRVNFKLVECKFVERENLLFLDIELDCPTLKEIEEKSKIISETIDLIDSSDKAYYLNIYSSGIEKEIDFNELEKYLAKNIQIFLIKPYLDQYWFEGELVSIKETSLMMLLNIKGCFRKIEFLNSNVKQIKNSIKLPKNKKENKWKTKETH